MEEHGSIGWYQPFYLLRFSFQRNTVATNNLATDTKIVFIITKLEYLLHFFEAYHDFGIMQELNGDYFILLNFLKMIAVKVNLIPTVKCH